MKRPSEHSLNKEPLPSHQQFPPLFTPQSGTAGATSTQMEVTTSGKCVDKRYKENFEGAKKAGFSRWIKRDLTRNTL